MIIDTDKIVAACIELQKRNLKATDENYFAFTMHITIYADSRCDGPEFEAYVPNAPRVTGKGTPEAALEQMSSGIATEDTLLAAAQTHDEEAKKIRDRIAAMKGGAV